MSGLEQRIECSSGRLLARATQDGVKFWCEKHTREELHTWEQLDTLRRSLQVQSTISAPTVIAPHVTR